VQNEKKEEAQVDASGNWTLPLAQQAETWGGKLKDDLRPIPPTPRDYFTLFLPSYHHLPMEREHSVGGKRRRRSRFLIVLFVNNFILFTYTCIFIRTFILNVNFCVFTYKLSS